MLKMHGSLRLRLPDRVTEDLRRENGHVLEEL